MAVSKFISICIEMVIFEKRNYLCLLLGPIMAKVASLSTSYLRIYEDEHKESNKIDVPTVKEPTTKVLHEVRLRCSGCNFKNCNHGFQVKVERVNKVQLFRCMTYYKEGGSGFDLLFDSPCDEGKFYVWNQAVQKAKELSAKGQTNLDELKS